MLCENIKQFRKAKGISQEELAIKLDVVRQTVSKWENGISVPDADMLIALAEELDTSVSVLLGETVREAPAEDLQAVCEKLETLNLQLARRNAAKRKAVRWALISLCVLTAAIFAALAAIHGAYMDWDYTNPELAVAGSFLHGFEFLFVRLAPIAFSAFLIGIGITYRRDGRS